MKEGFSSRRQTISKSPIPWPPELHISSSTRTCISPADISVGASSRQSTEAEDATVMEDKGVIKVQFKRVYKNLRFLVIDLIRRERSRYGLTGRRKQPEGTVEAQSRRGTKTNHSDYAESPEEPQKGRNDSQGKTTNVHRVAKNSDVLDTLSTVLSSCYDDEWDPMVQTMTAPLDDTAVFIRPGLYISGFLAEQNKDDLKNKGISHILQVGENLTRTFEGDFEYKTLSIMDTDSTNVLAAFKESLLFLDGCISNGGAALVHCYAGISRSATICIAYLMWSENLTMGAAYCAVQSARKVAQPNEGFKNQLRIFESLGSNLCNLDRYLSVQTQTCRNRTRELSSDDWDVLI